MVASALAYHEGNEHLAMCLGGIGLPAVGQWGSLFDGRANFVAFTHQAWVKHVADSPQGEAWRPWVDWAASRYGFPGLD